MMDAQPGQTAPLFKIPHDGAALNHWHATPIASLSRSIRDTHQEILAASQAQSLIEQTNTSLNTSLEGGAAEVEHLREIVKQQQHALETTRTFIDSCMSSIPITLRPTDASSIKATQVLATPELFEQILLYLAPREVLRAVQINKAAHQIFNDSPKLQDRLGLRVSPNGFLASVFDSWSSFCHRAEKFDNVNARLTDDCDCRPGWGAPSSPHECSNKVHFSFDWDTAKLPTIGSMCRMMLVCQPPAYRMSVEVHCCSHIRRSPSLRGWGGSGYVSHESDADFLVRDGVDDASDGAASESGGINIAEADSFNDVIGTPLIASRNGITVGDVYDAVAKLRTAHLYCPHAAVEEHNGDGTVTSGITFSAVLALRHDDPYLIEREATVQRNELNDILASRSEGAVSQQIMSVYVKAKRKGES